MKSGHGASASELMKAALATNQDVETLANAGLFYDRMGEYEKAFASYKSIMLQVPEDTASLAKMKASYNLWKKGIDGWDVEWNDLNEKWKKDMTVQLQKEIMQVKAHDYIKGIVDLQGRPVTNESVKNKIVIIDFWATWCVPCMHEMPYVQKAYEKFANREDVAFMIVNSGAKNSLEDAKGWWGNKKYSFPVYYNTDEQIGEKFGFDFIPSVYIIDKSGNIRFKTIGFEGPSIQRKIEAAIELLSGD